MSSTGNWYKIPEFVRNRIGNFDKKLQISANLQLCANQWTVFALDYPSAVYKH